MSFEKCILDKIKSDNIPETKAAELILQYRNLVERYIHTMGDEAAAHHAAAKVVEIKSKVTAKKLNNDMNHALAERRLDAALDARAKELQADIDKVKVGKFWYGNPYNRAVMELLQSAYTRQGSIRNKAHKNISLLIEKYRSTHAGLKQDVAGFVDVVREMGGKSTGNSKAAAFGKAVRETFDELHRMFEQEGGIIGKLDNYFPQKHIAERVGAVKFEVWRDKILPLLDLDRMTDPQSGFPMSGSRLEIAMYEAYQSIRTKGFIDIASMSGEGKKLFGSTDINSRAASSRFFHFKDVDAWLEYNEAFGGGNRGLFDAMMDHIDMMARDIALMQKMGPKPNAMMAQLSGKMESRGSKAPGRLLVEGEYTVLAGINSYAGELGRLTKINNGWLNVKRAAYLGAAPVSALSDTFFIAYAAKMNGLEATDVLKNYAKLMNPLDKTDRMIARQHFFIAQAAMGMSLQGVRHADEMGSGGWTSWLAGLTNRASGLAAMTDAGKAAAAMSLSGALAVMKTTGKAWQDIDPNFRKMAEVYGISKEDWAAVMQAEITTLNGDVHFLLPESVAKLGNHELALKLEDWFEGIGNLAVNEPNLMSRAITTGAFTGAPTSHGTPMRIAASNVFFAKSFAVTLMINHIIPTMRDVSQGRLKRLAVTTAGTTLLGGLAVQARQIISGKDPHDMFEDGVPKRNFWTAAMLQGGGLGIFGDFMFGSTTRYGSSLGATVVGPILGTFDALAKAGDLPNLGDKKTTDKVLSDVWKVASREIPSVRLWYTRLVVERVMLDQVEKMLNPAYDDRMRKIERKMQKESGAGYWWKPGKLTPSRAPDLEVNK